MTRTTTILSVTALAIIALGVFAAPAPSVAAAPVAPPGGTLTCYSTFATDSCDINAQCNRKGTLGQSHVWQTIAGSDPEQLAVECNAAVDHCNGDPCPTWY
jgi:type 1 fimbria pilin